MRKFVMGIAAAALLSPIAASSASAQPYGYNARGGYNNEVRREQRECRRELRRAESRREYLREQRECRREIAQARREARRDHRGWRNDHHDRRGYRGW